MNSQFIHFSSNLQTIISFRIINRCILLVYLLQFIACYDKRLDDDNLSIFQPFPLLKIQAQDLCQNSRATIIAEFMSNQKNFLAINMIECGIFICDITIPIQPKIAQFLKSKGTISSLSITHSQKYMWIGYSNGDLEIIDVSNLQFPVISFTIVKNENTPDQSDLVNKVIYFQDLDLLFLACINNFKLVSLVQNNLKVIKTIKLLDLNISRLRLAFKKTLLIVSGNNQMHFFSFSVNQQQQQLNKQCSFRPTSASRIVTFEVIQDKVLIIQLQFYSYIMIGIEQYIQSYDGKSCNESLIVYFDRYPALIYGSIIHVSKDERFLYSNQRSIGVYIFDISQLSFEIFQIIRIDGDSTDLLLGQDGKFLFYSNQFSVQIFEKTSPNLNLNTPNLLINQFQQVTYSSFKPETGNTDLFMIYQEPQNNLYMTRKEKGSATFQYKGSGILEEQSFVENNIPNISHAYEAFVPNTSLMYLTRELQGLQILDYKDVKQPKILKSSLTLGLSYVKFQQLLFNSKGTICFIANVINVIILEIKDNPLEPVVIALVDVSAYTQGDQTLFRLTLSNDEKKLYTIQTLYGFTVIDIQDIQKPKFLSRNNIGSLYHLLLTQDSKYLIAGAGFLGVLIYELFEDGNQTLISQVKLKGSILSISLIYNDNYLLASGIENPSLNLVCIADKKNPFLIQQLMMPLQDYLFFIATSRDQSLAFVSGRMKLHLFFLQSPVIIHTQMYQLEPIPNSNQFLQVSIPKGQPLLIGQQIDFYLMSIYQKKEFKIVKALYYTNYALQNLPHWMQFLPAEKVLKLQISKDSIQGDQSGNTITRSLQQVVFLIYQQLGDNEFVNNYLGINQADSIALKKACLSLGFLDQEGYVSETYSPKNNFSFGSSDQQIQYLQKWSNQPKKMQQILDLIQFTLNQNIINHVLQFYTQQSLVVNFDGIQNPITSNQQLVVVTLKTSQGRFVDKSYSGILIVISAQQDVIELQGSISSINSVLLKKIKLSLSDTYIQKQVQINVQIDDQTNFKYIKTLDLNQAVFISIQSPVQHQENLQKDFNQKYQNGEIALQTNFIYQISQSAFICLDSDLLTFNAKIQIDGDDFKDIPTGFWLSFSSNERTFAGTPPSNVFNKQYTILVNATDGYTAVQDKFQLKITILPFFVLFQLIVQILGPILGILGFWKYRAAFYNVILKSNYIYTKEVAYVDKSYQKIIPITDDTLSIAIEIWGNVRKQIPVKEVLRQMEMMLCRIKMNNPRIINLESVLLKNNESVTLQEELIKSIHTCGIDETEVKYLNNSLKKVYEGHKITQTAEMKSFMQTTSVQQHQLTNSPMNSPTSKFIYDYQNQLSKYPKMRKQQTSSFIDQNTRKYTKSIVKEVEDQEKIQKILQIEEQKETQKFNLFQSDGSIDISHIISQIVSKEEALPEQKQTLPRVHFTTIKDTNSRLAVMIKGLAAAYFVECSPMCKYIVTSLKRKAMILYQEIDWYRAYVNTFSIQKEDREDTFPNYLLNKVSIGLALEEVIQEIQKNISLGKNTEIPFIKKDIIQSNKIKEEIISYISLIEDYMQAMVLGISKCSRKYFQVTQGECLHCNPCRIRSIKTFEKGKSYGYCISAQNFFGTNQVEKGLSENQRLPDWLTIDFKKSMITLKGTPNKYNIGSIEIKIYDIDGYLVRCFELQVLPDKGSQIQENQQQDLLKFSLQSDKQFQVKKNILIDRFILQKERKFENESDNDDKIDEGSIIFNLQNRTQKSNSKNQEYTTKLQSISSKENLTINFEKNFQTNE